MSTNVNMVFLTEKSNFLHFIEEFDKENANSRVFEGGADYIGPSKVEDLEALLNKDLGEYKYDETLELSNENAVSFEYLLSGKLIEIFYESYSIRTFDCFDDDHIIFVLNTPEENNNPFENLYKVYGEIIVRVFDQSKSIYAWMDGWSNIPEYDAIDPPLKIPPWEKSLYGISIFSKKHFIYSFGRLAYEKISLMEKHLTPNGGVFLPSPEFLPAGEDKSLYNRIYEDYINKSI